MNRFATLIDRLAYEPRRNAKIVLLRDYFASTPDPERGYALAALTGALSFKHAKPALIRTLVSERTDPVLFRLSYDFVGDLSETVALIWPVAARPRDEIPEQPSLSTVVETLATLGKTELPHRLAAWLDALDETGRWALLKLITGGLRIGVSARLAKTAISALGPHAPDAIEDVWHGVSLPYRELFAWAEGQGPRPEHSDPAPFRPVMLAHAIEDSDFDTLEAKDFVAEWKWDGIRVQAVSARDEDGRHVTRLYSRTGDDISNAFPDLADALAGIDAAIDGELLIVRDGVVQDFNTLQKRLNRTAVNAKLLQELPAAIRAYDLLFADGRDWREAPFSERRERLNRLVREQNSTRLDLSPLVPFETWDELRAARRDPAALGADAKAIEGVMLKRSDSAYLPGRPKGYWYKWKRDPFTVDAVLMYAQRGHGKRSSFYSDYTFGVWRAGPHGDELVPVGKAYFGFTDAELRQIDSFVRRNTTNRFGPVREVTHTPDEGLVFEVAFEGLSRSTRHKSGLAMRFPRIARLRWDKPPREADRIETLETLADGAAMRLIAPSETDERNIG
jgi:DNA ligase-1